MGALSQKSPNRCVGKLAQTYRLQQRYIYLGLSTSGLSQQACPSVGKQMTLHQREVGWNKSLHLTGLTNTMRPLHRVWAYQILHMFRVQEECPIAHIMPNTNQTHSWMAEHMLAVTRHTLCKVCTLLGELQGP